MVYTNQTMVQGVGSYFVYFSNYEVISSIAVPELACNVSTFCTSDNKASLEKLGQSNIGFQT